MRRCVISALERGDLYLFYRPRVECEQVTSIDDVQRFFVIMRPNDRHVYRRLVVGRKRLPDPGKPEKHWAFIDRVGPDSHDVIVDFPAATYRTRTLGERFQPAARPAGEGSYAIVPHHKHVHFAYRLHVPEEPGEVQTQLGIQPAASYIVAVRNPDATWLPPRPDVERVQPFGPDEKRALFGRARFIPLHPDLLDRVDTDLVIIGVAAVTGFDVTAEWNHADEVLRELANERHDHPSEPLFEGTWGSTQALVFPG